MSYSFHVNFSVLGKVVLEKKIFEIFPIQGHVKTVSPIVTPPNSGGQDFNKLAFVFYQKAFK
jgi:hypothetical protein